MTKLDQIMNYAKNLPVDQQDSLAEKFLEVLKGRGTDIRLTPEELADVKAAIENPNPKYATDERVRDVLGATFK